MNEQLEAEVRERFIGLCEAVIAGKVSLVVCDTKPAGMPDLTTPPVEEAYLICVAVPSAVLGATQQIEQLVPMARMFTAPPFGDYEEPKRVVAQIAVDTAPAPIPLTSGLILPPGVADLPRKVPLDTPAVLQ